MQKILKALLVIFVLIGAAYFFLIDTLIKSQIEQQGSRALQAPLHVGKASLHLLSMSLTLHDVEVGSAHMSDRNLVEARELVLPFSLSDLFAHKYIVETLDIHGLRFNHRNGQATTAANTNTTVTNSTQVHEALQHIQQMLNNPLASRTIDPNMSITGALLGEQFKPLLLQITTALNAITAPAGNSGDWQILIRHANIDGTLDIGSASLPFAGTLDNITPQPQQFDVVTQLELHSTDKTGASLHANGSLDKRKLTQLALRFDVNNFPITQWPVSADPELKVTALEAVAAIQAILSLTGNQFDLNALSHFQQAKFDIANGDNAVARTIADVWRKTDAFDINLQISGDLQNPLLKMNSSLDVPLTNALQQLQVYSAPSTTLFAP